MTRTPLRQLPTSKRPRERMATMGAGNLTTVELLAIILGKGTHQVGVLELAEKIVFTFGEHLRKITSPQLMQLTGIGAVQASRVMASIELGHRLAARPLIRTIHKPDDVLREAETIRHSHREHMVGLYLNARYELLKKQVLTIGSVNSNAIEARDVYASALTLPCRSLILIHNHPSGDPQPSQEDIDVTRRLQQAGDLLGVTLLDHVIVSEIGYVSLQQEKLL